MLDQKQHKDSTKIRMAEYMVHIGFRGNSIIFAVYPVVEWFDFGSDDTGIYYTCKATGQTTVGSFNTDTCLRKLEGSFCWRGVWEGRLYFPDDEYWGEEISELSEL